VICSYLFGLGKQHVAYFFLPFFFNFYFAMLLIYYNLYIYDFVLFFVFWTILVLLYLVITWMMEFLCILIQIFLSHSRFVFFF
jgi:hypothetical protein